MSKRRGRGLLIAGTSSDAGKSLVVTGLCRVLHRRGVAVAPFKSQNMSNNSMVCGDGAEIGRAQYLQAQAAGAQPCSAMNPVLLKPGSDRRSFVVVRGRSAGTLEAGEYATGRRALAEAAFSAYEELSSAYDVIVCEGAGSPAEINLRGGDYVNMGLARRFGLPVVIVGDIDRGGVFAALLGTIELLDGADRALVQGFLINKFRGDATLLDPALDALSQRTGVPFLGVLPWLPDVWLDAEDTLQVGRWSVGAASGAEHCGVASDAERVLHPAEAERIRPAADAELSVAVVRLPRLSNATDVDALAAEPGVAVTMTADPAALRSAHLVVLPGSRSTVEDLRWLRARGLDCVIAARAAGRQPVLGICGGNQMLAETITDDVESHAGRVPGLGLLPTDVVFGAEKILGRPGSQWRGEAVEGYEIHHGVSTVRPAADGEAFLDGWRRGAVWGTTWHGTLENDGFRRAWLQQIAADTDSAWAPAPGGPSYADRRESMIDTLADAIEAHYDVAALLRLLGVGP